MRNKRKIFKMTKKDVENIVMCLYKLSRPKEKIMIYYLHSVLIRGGAQGTPRSLFNFLEFLHKVHSCTSF